MMTRLAPQRGGMFIDIKPQKVQLRRSDMQPNMPPRWGLSVFVGLYYKHVAPTELAPRYRPV
jgi:hypothetical protein